MDAVRREKAIYLRKSKRLSYSEIGKRLKVPKSTLSYWLKDLPLSDSEIRALKKTSWKKGEASRELYRNSMRKRKELEIKKIYNEQKESILPLSDRDQFIAGLMLYVGEGDKRNPSRIGLANNDPVVISFFTQWLLKFADIPREKIRFGLHLYSNMNIAKERKFWQDTIGFGRLSFYKDQIREVRTAFSYNEGNRHGTCTVYVIGSKPKTFIIQAIKVVQEELTRV